VRQVRDAIKEVGGGQDCGYEQSSCVISGAPISRNLTNCCTLYESDTLEAYVLDNRGGLGEKG
jgi:hypothetical protein